MRSNLTLFLSIFFPVAMSAQLSHGGSPMEWGEADQRSGIPVVALPAPLVDPSDPGDGGEFIYGEQRFMQIDVPATGQWTESIDGRRVCRVAIESGNAEMISVQFDRWEIPEGAMVYLYDAARTTYLGGFDQRNRGPHGGLATAVVPGDRVVIEYQLPAGAPEGELRVASITHGHVDLFGFRQDRDIDPGYQSAPCNINVICPEAAAWQDQKRAVALFLRPTGAGCTGVLLNNTATPGTPYFHVANHCYQPTENEWVFYFNYESPGCVGSVGPSNQTLTGATVRAINYYADFVLLELWDTPPASYNVYYAGWDRSGNTPASGTVIHHPHYDVKKITFNNGPVTSHVHEDGWQLWRNYWDNGIVQAVSSGAPMFDQNKRMVGHMFDGEQDCTNSATVPTDCAKFSVSWDGSAPSTRLRDWLDPSNTTITLDGYQPNATPQLAVRARAFLEGPFVSATNLMNATLRANGLVPLNEPYTAIGYSHVNGGGGESTTNAVLSVTGNNAIVDWVVLELRNKNNSSQVLATRSALIQRDGDIVDVNGTSDVTFNMPPDEYFLAVRHRNHLGAMTSAAISFTSSPSLVDLTSGAVPMFGGGNALKSIGSKLVMFGGDVNMNSTISYAGPDNDRDKVLVRIGGVVPTNTVSGYYPEDLNMDGVVRYTGANNDRDTILVNIGGSVPTNVKPASLP